MGRGDERTSLPQSHGISFRLLQYPPRSHMKKLLKKLLPESVVLYYHYCVAQLAAFVYGRPSKKMITIGITGTKGKTSTANFIWACLMAGGLQPGSIFPAHL